MAGPWEKYRSGTQGIPIGPQDPAAPYRGQQAATGIQAQQSNMQSDAVSRARTGQQMQQDAVMLDPRLRAAQAEAALKEQQAMAAKAEAASKDPFNANILAEAKNDAMSKLQTIDRIRGNDRKSWLPTIGFGAETMAEIGGTGAASIAADIDTLKSGSALSEVLKMTLATGKNPFTPMSNSDVALIANNRGNLSQRPDRETFMANLKNYENAYKNMYAGAVGKETLDAEIARLLPGIAPAKRDAFIADAKRRYNEATRGGIPKRKPKTPWYGNAPRKSASVINYEDWKD